MDDVAILTTPFELQEVQIPMCVVYFFYIYVWTYCNTWLSVGGAGIAFKATIAKKPDYYMAKKSIVILFHIRNEVRIQFQMF